MTTHIEDVTDSHAIQIQGRRAYRPQDGGWVADGVFIAFTAADGGMVRYHCTIAEARLTARRLLEVADALEAPTEGRALELVERRAG